jgi:hypothetical protein
VNEPAILTDKHAARDQRPGGHLTAHDGGTLVAIAHSGLPTANGTGTPSAGAITWPAWHWPPPAVTWHRT